MTNWHLWTGLTLLGLTLACGNGDEEPEKPLGTKIDCSWFVNDNCYKQALASAKHCLPDESTFGALSATGGSCAYDSGHTIAFNKPISRDPMDDAEWDFDVSNSAGQCLSYEEIRHGFRLETPGGTFIQDAAGISILRMTCPDGSMFYMDDAMELASCGIGQMPGYVAYHSPDRVGFVFIGGMEEPVSTFECRF